MFFNFVNFFAFFLEICIPGRVGTDRIENFFSLSLLACPVLFWIEKKS